MTYKTHLATGYTAALLFTNPSSLSELVMCIGVSSIGSVISDIDASTSESRKNLGKVLAASAIGIAVILAGDYFWNLGIVSRFRNSAALMRLFTGFIVFIGICIFGEHRPHRSFMHSLLGVAAITFSFSVIIPSSAKYLAVSMLSHILIDMLNKKKIQLFYPLKKPKIGFNICYADGMVNRMLFFLASATSVLLIALKLYDIIPKMF